MVSLLGLATTAGSWWASHYARVPGMHWKEGGTPPCPLQGAQPMPTHCLPGAKWGKGTVK